MKVSLSMTLDGLVRALRLKRRSMVEKVEGRRGRASEGVKMKGRGAREERSHERGRT